MNLKTRFAAGLTSAALIASMAGPAFAATSVEIGDNGSKSDNKVEIENKHEVNIEQKNYLDVTLNINSTASTGGNKANGNTGGDVEVETGDATTETSVLILAGSNKAKLSDCGCDSDTDLNIKRNGRKSDNKIKLENKHELDVDQKNDADIVGNIDSKSKTGKNKANGNTNGSSKIKTGKSVSTTDVAVISGSNVLK